MFTATISGRMGKEPEVKAGTDGKEYATVSVAVDQPKKVDGEWTNVTTWVRVLAFGRDAGTLGRFGKKGAILVASGELEVGVWTGRDGDARADVTLRASSVEVPRMGEGGGQPERRPAPARQESTGGGWDDDGSVPF